MTLTNCSDSSSDILLSSPASSPSLSFISSSTSFLSSPQPPRKMPKKTGRKQKPKSIRNSTYKHVPHRLKPPHVVAKRNARERKRVQAVNGAFSRLRKHIPFEPRHRRLSKVKTLRFAIEYIQQLQKLIANHDMQATKEQHPQGMYTNFNHYYYHHREQRHLIINKSGHDLVLPRRSEIHHERQTSSNKVPDSSGDGAVFINVPNPTSNLHGNDEEERVFSFMSSRTVIPSSQHCSSFSPDSVKVSFSTIHNLPSCLRNNNAAECASSHQFPDFPSLTNQTPSTTIDHSSSHTSIPNGTPETMTCAQDLSHFSSFCQSFLHPGISTSNNMSVYPNFLSSHLTTSSPTPQLTSVDGCSRPDNSSTILSPDIVSYMQRTLRPVSIHEFPPIDIPVDCGDSTAQFGMFQSCPIRSKTAIIDGLLVTRPQTLINSDQVFSFADSNFDQEMAQLDL